MAAKGFIFYFFSKTVCVMVSLCQCLLVNVDKNWLLSSGFFFSEKKVIQSVENGHTKKLVF